MSRIADLLEDPEFIRWVKFPDKELNTFWRSWLAANPDRVEDLKLAKEIILGLQFPSPNASSDTKKEVLTRILRAKDNLPQEQQVSTRTVQRVWQRKTWQLSRVAAILAGVFLLSILLLNLTKTPQKEEAMPKAVWLSKSTNAGEKLNFRLPDQTIVSLNSGSSLEYPEAFDSTVRLVKLKGEGFFEVSESAGQPFKVISEGLTTTALGTSFNINAKNNDELKVSLVTGKVSISYGLDSRDYFLIPGEELSYTKSDNEGNVHQFNESHVLGWRFGRLIFKRSTFKEVKKSLEEWYGVKISMVGSYRNDWRFNGKFENQTLENVLNSMSNIENFNYEIENKKVKVIFNNQLNK